VPLEKPQARRLERAELRGKVRSKEWSLEYLLRKPPECVLEMPLISLLEMVPYVGYVRIAQLNYEAMRRGINICLPVGALTPKAKSFIIEWESRRGKQNS